MQFLKEKKYWILLLIILIAYFENVFPQSQQFRQITVKNGLSNSYVNCLLQDRNGFIWIGTDDGLNRFDGYEIKVYRNNLDDKNSITENIIWAICEDHSGYLWIGTKTGGLNRYDPKTNKFEKWNLSISDSPEINITSIFEDSKRNIWIGTYRNGLFRLNANTSEIEHWQNYPDKQKVLTDNFVTSIVEDQLSNIWIGTYNGLNKYIPSEKLISFREIIIDFKIPVWHLSKSSFYNNSIWIGTLKGLMRLDITTEKITNVQLPEKDGLNFGLSVSSVVEEYYLDNEILWISTFDGLVKINLTTSFKDRFLEEKNNDSDLLSDEIHELMIDKSGVVWIATENGLNFYPAKKSKFNFRIPIIGKMLDFPELFNNSVRAITQSKNKSLWLGTELGLYEIRNNDKDIKLIQSSEFNSLNVWSLCKGSSNNIWVGTYGQGIKELDLNTQKIKSWKVSNPNFNEQAYNYIRTIIEDNNGELWIGFWGGGLARLNPKTSNIEYWRNDKNNPKSLSYNDIWVIINDRRGRIWIGTNGGGLDLYQGQDKNNFYNWNFNKTNKQKLSSNNIYSICESNNRNTKENETILWIGTANGLNKFVISNDTSSIEAKRLDIQISYYTVENGLPDNTVESILEDDNGNLWIGTSSGISFFNIKSKKFTNFTTEDGLIGTSFNTGASYKTFNGEMLFGSLEGVNFFNPSKIELSNYSPPIIISKFQVLNNTKGNKSNSGLMMSSYNNEKVTLFYNQNDIFFQFSSLDFNSPEENKYQYYLNGFDDDWNFSDNRRFVTYTNLDPGEYEFWVRATNSDGVWSKQIAKLKILINPPFWKTWWAYTVYVLAGLSLLTFIRTTEIKKRKIREEERLRHERETALLREAELKTKNIEQEKEIEKQKIRNRIAQDLHDEIGSNLSSISLMSEIIQKDVNTNSEIAEKLKRIHKVAKGSTQSIRDIVWLTNPASDGLSNLVSKMKEVIDNTNWNFKLNSNFPQKVIDINLNPELKRNIFFIFKETMNNIVKHSNAQNVELKFEIKENIILLSISDDGMGFNKHGNFNGIGIKNIKNRANEIDAILNYESNLGSGTLMKLVVNFT
ncbi:MAG: hypothetical protein IPM32_18425 [Ignavibacteriae bacterium]|nr:hypothetical protein [Ignavibacteriota bacterium]